VVQATAELSGKLRATLDPGGSITSSSRFQIPYVSSVTSSDWLLYEYSSAPLPAVQSTIWGIVIHRSPTFICQHFQPLEECLQRAAPLGGGGKGISSH